MGFPLNTLKAARINFATTNSVGIMSFSSEFAQDISERSDIRGGGRRLEEVIGETFEIDLDFSVGPVFVGGQRVLPDGKRVSIPGRNGDIEGV